MLDLDIIVVFRARLHLSYGGWRASTKSMEKWQPIYTGAIRGTVAGRPPWLNLRDSYDTSLTESHRSWMKGMSLKACRILNDLRCHAAGISHSFAGFRAAPMEERLRRCGKATRTRASL